MAVAESRNGLVVTRNVAAILVDWNRFLSKLSFNGLGRMRSSAMPRFQLSKLWLLKIVQVEATYCFVVVHKAMLRQSFGLFMRDTFVCNHQN
jgi:hypothetical protein